MDISIPYTFGAVIGALNTGGVIGLLVLIILGGARKWWVFGWQYTDIKEERDEWKDTAQTGAKAAERAVSIAEAYAPRSRDEYHKENYRERDSK